ncbi:RNA-binding domain-containing protein [Punctularia strigosozonata HHB-11173 SS5]|uniref:RNA-binding domain-containing protein n=1 Tax=Punctularia strigosozonata (strain HHB-11173) TaxID=741275 RepID=UPI0004418686|nr:RNA-binding domain-containing protein [Punctularia strigosozonata HHB-11173 SS5]EIN11061.1 RNA-binding domain-containing protein [Punctularia strigosozonata HHB-11173 SS5]
MTPRTFGMNEYSPDGISLGAGGVVDSWPNMNRHPSGLTAPAQNPATPIQQSFSAPQLHPPARQTTFAYPTNNSYSSAAPQEDHRDYRRYSPPRQTNPTASTASFDSPAHIPISSADSQSHPATLSTATLSSRSTLWWGNLEPWMDEEYAKQVCGLMGWNPVDIKVPSPAEAGQSAQANNPGYCFLSFSNPAQAAAVLAQVNGNGGNAAIMPNSTRPFTLNWASSIPQSALNTSMHPPNSVPGQPFQKEYSIFVGDLAPEASNSDLVAVFRNPVLGLRNDREPKFIRPFLSCKSAKIMLDPATGVSKGYGFVRFTDEADQQRALVEMHGLYCLSRPMRISPATAKFKPPTSLNPLNSADLARLANGLTQVSTPSNAGVPSQIASIPPQKSVTTPVAFSPTAPQPPPFGSPVNNQIGSGGVTPSSSAASTTSGSSTLVNTSVEDATKNLPPDVIAQLAQYANGNAASAVKSSGAVNSITSPFAAQQQQQQQQARQESDMDQKYVISEESWKHHAQARAILSNLIGPNGEQLTSMDPYNTTVFVGGLSPLISEDTLRTFFAPFGDIHYVKVPVGKHCGFVQFVRKADAERAIEKMQGFPIGGSRIRLSWGRSQYKAAQAAAQAAQAAAMQAHLQHQLQTQVQPTAPLLTTEQAMQLLQRLDLGAFASTGAVPSNSDAFAGRVAPGDGGRTRESEANAAASHFESFAMGDFTGNSFNGPTDRRSSMFSPFSPDMNSQAREGHQGPDFSNFGGSQSHQSRHPTRHVSNFVPAAIDTHAASKVVGASRSSSGKVSPVTPTSRPGSSGKFGTFTDAAHVQTQRSDESQHHPVVGRTYSYERQSGVNLGNAQEDSMASLQDLNGMLASLDLDSHGYAAGNHATAA